MNGQHGANVTSLAVEGFSHELEHARTVLTRQAAMEAAFRGKYATYKIAEVS